MKGEKKKEEKFYTPFSWFVLISGTDLVLACRSDSESYYGFELWQLWLSHFFGSLATQNLIIFFFLKLGSKMIIPKLHPHSSRIKERFKHSENASFQHEHKDCNRVARALSLYALCKGSSIDTNYIFRQYDDFQRSYQIFLIIMKKKKNHLIEKTASTSPIEKTICI